MTQKSESVREAEQCRTIEDLVYEFTLLHYPACKISREAMSDGLMLLARNVIKLLAEEAEQEARECWENQKKHVDRYGFLASELSNRQHDREAVAAWLREKAR